MRAYRIVHWATCHENHEARKYVRLAWYSKPNSHQGLAFRFLVKQDDRNDLYAAWALMLDVASQGERCERGWLVRQGRALSAMDLELLTGFAQGMFERAIEFFCKPQVGWLQEDEFEKGQPPGTPGDSAATRRASGRTVRTHNSTVQDSTTEPTEKKGLAATNSPAGQKVQASRTQWAALTRQVKELADREEELTAPERQLLKEKRVALALLEAKQANGEF